MTDRSPLAPAAFPALPEIAGVTRRIARAHYKNWDRCDLTYVELTPGTVVAGVTTQNVCCSTEVEMCREGIAHGRARALIVNAGNSNAFTGYRGREAVEQIVDQVAAHLACDPREVFVCSTGVIGVPLPKDKAHAGVAKVISYIFTDAAVAPDLLQAMLSEATAGSFNAITVDSDTSTSDTVLLFATGRAGNPVLTTRDDPGADALYAAIRSVALDLAQLVVRDGEGASKFIEITVTGAVSDASAKRVALSRI